MGAREALPLLLDDEVTPLIRVRHWRQIGPCPRWPPSAHDRTEIAWVVRGSVRYVVGRQTIELGAGNGFVVPAGHEHETRIHHDTEALSIWLDQQLVLDMEASMGASRRLDAHTLVDPSVSTLAHLVLHEARETQAGTRLIADALAEALCIKVLRKSAQNGRPSARDPRIRRAVELVEDGYQAPLTVRDMAQHAGMSRYHFSRSFKSHTGLSPYQYLTQTRVRRAAEMLRRGRTTVTEAALTVGFADLSRFARAFRRYQGCSPSDYARTNRATLSSNRLAPHALQDLPLAP